MTNEQVAKADALLDALAEFAASGSDALFVINAEDAGLMDARLHDLRKGRDAVIEECQTAIEEAAKRFSSHAAKGDVDAAAWGAALNTANGLSAGLELLKALPVSEG